MYNLCISIEKIVFYVILKYELETFVEKRSIHYCHEPYTDQLLSNISQKSIQISKPWDIDIKPDHLFIDNIVYFRIPDTEYKKVCAFLIELIIPYIKN